MISEMSGRRDAESGVTVKGKPELRICHLADVHLGYRRYNKLTKGGLNQREVDVSRAFREAIDRTIALRPHLTIIAGDLFHAVRPSNMVATLCFKELRRLALGTRAPVIIVAGNHESPKRIDTGSILRLFAEIEGVFVADTQPEQFTFPDLGLSVFCLPHVSLARIDEVTVRADDRFRYNVLVLHGQVNERWVSDFGGVEVDMQKLSPHEWDYIALGHVHLHREVMLNALYPGSLEHTASNIWAEGGTQKGFVEFHLPSGKKTFHALTSPREVLVLPSVDALYKEPAELMELISDRIAAVPGGIEGKIIRLEVFNLTREVFRQLDHKRLRAWRAEALNLTFDVRTPAANSEGSVLRRAPGARLRDELKEFCLGWQSPSVKPDAIQTMLQKYLGAVEGEDEAR